MRLFEEDGEPLPDELVTLNDAGVVAFVAEHFKNRLHFDTVGGGDPGPSSVLMLRLFVRAAELGAKIDVVDLLNDHAMSVWTAGWPVDAAHAALLKRAARAFGVDERSLPFGQGKLSEYRVRREVVSTPEAVQQPETHDLLTTLANYYPSIAVASALAPDAAHTESIARAVNALRLPADLKQYVIEQLGLQPQHRAPSAPSSRSPSFASAEQPLFERRQPIGPPDEFVVATGPLATTATPGVSYHRTRDQGLLREFFVTSATDENVASLASVGFQGRQKWMNWLGPKHPTLTAADVINFEARRTELHPDPLGMPYFYIHQDSFKEVAFEFGDDSIAPFLRLARASNISLDDIKVTTPQGQTVTLRARAEALELPKYAEHRDIDATQAMSLLAPNARVSFELKLQALAELQSPSVEAPGFAEVMRMARAALEQGALTPIDFAALSPAHQMTVLAALTTDRHLGAATVLSALFVRNVGPALTAHLIAKGQPAADVERWVSLGERLSKLGPSDQRFVLESVAAEAPDFRQVPLRVELAEQEALTTADISSFFERTAGDDVMPTLRAMVEWAKHRGDSAVTAVTEFLNGRLESGELESPTVNAAFSAGSARPFVEEAMLETLMTAAQKITTASANQRPALTAELLAQVKAASTMVPTDEVLGALFERLHQADLSRVIALDELEAQHDGVYDTSGQFAQKLRQHLDVDDPVAALAEASRLHRGAAQTLKMLKVRVAFELSRAVLQGSSLADIVEGARQQAETVLTNNLDATAKDAAERFRENFNVWLDELAAEWPNAWPSN